MNTPFRSLILKSFLSIAPARSRCFTFVKKELSIFRSLIDFWYNQGNLSEHVKFHTLVFCSNMRLDERFSIVFQNGAQISNDHKKLTQQLKLLLDAI